MERIISVRNVYKLSKYKLVEEYKNTGIYQEVTPNGYAVHQSWLINKPGRHPIVIESYNNMIIEELYDIIDRYIESGKFKLRVMLEDDCYFVHPNGSHII